LLPTPTLPPPPPVPIPTPEPKDPTALLTLLDVLVLFQNVAPGFSEPALLGLTLGSDSHGACGVSGSGPLGGVNRFGSVRDHRREGAEDEADEIDLSTVEVVVEIVCTDRRAGLGVDVGMGVMERGVTAVPEPPSVTVEVCTLGVVLVSICWHSASVSECTKVCFLYRGGG